MLILLITAQEKLDHILHFFHEYLYLFDDTIKEFKLLFWRIFRTYINIQDRWENPWAVLKLAVWENENLLDIDVNFLVYLVCVNFIRDSVLVVLYHILQDICKLLCDQNADYFLLEIALDDIEHHLYQRNL